MYRYYHRFSNISLLIRIGIPRAGTRSWQKGHLPQAQHSTIARGRCVVNSFWLQGWHEEWQWHHHSCQPSSGSGKERKRELGGGAGCALSLPILSCQYSDPIFRSWQRWSQEFRSCTGSREEEERTPFLLTNTPVHVVAGHLSCLPIRQNVSRLAGWLLQVFIAMGMKQSTWSQHVM